MTIEVYKITPSFSNGFERGYKVLQYETNARGERVYFGSRYFEDEYEANAYKDYLERKRG